VLGISKAENEETRPRGTNRIPPHCGTESVSVATWVIAQCDIVEAEPRVASVQPGVEPAEGWVAS